MQLLRRTRTLSKGKPGANEPVERGFWRWLILRLLSNEPMHGYDMLKHFQKMLDRDGGSSSVYPTLATLADEGLVTVEMRNEKRLYHISSAGREALEKSPNERFEMIFQANADALKRRDVLHETIDAFERVLEQAAKCGDVNARMNLSKLLNDTRKEIFRTLADADD